MQSDSQEMIEIKEKFTKIQGDKFNNVNDISLSSKSFIAALVKETGLDIDDAYNLMNYLSEKHAYEYTFLCGLIDHCSKIKYLDYRSFIASVKNDFIIIELVKHLNSTSVPMNISGIVDHYYKEKELGQKINEMSFDNIILMLKELKENN